MTDLVPLHTAGTEDKFSYTEDSQRSRGSEHNEGEEQAGTKQSGLRCEVFLHQVPT